MPETTQEKLHAIRCPHCGCGDALQLEQAVIQVWPIAIGPHSKLPHPDYDECEMHDSETVQFQGGHTHEIACYSPVCKGRKEPAPEWVVDALHANERAEWEAFKADRERKQTRLTR